MSGWDWALMALSGQGGSEISMAALEVAADVHKQTGAAEAIVELADLVSKENTGPVLKAYFEAQPG